MGNSFSALTKFFAFIVIIIIGVCSKANAQLSLNAASTNYTIDFDNTVAGSNNGVLNGITPAAVPGVGFLDSDGWAVTPATYNGQSAGTVTTAGWYSFLVNTGSRGLGAQPSSSFTNHSASLVILNNTGSTITNLNVSFKLYSADPQGRNATITYTGSSGSGNSGTETTDNILTTGTSTISSWKYITKTMTITGLTLASSSTYTLTWSSDRGVTTGSSDEWALDDIVVNGTVAAGCTPPTTQASALTSTSVNCTSVTLNWTRGTGNNVLVTGIGGASATSNPANAVSYTGNAVFTSGSSVGGGYAVYNGSGTSVTVSGLSGNTQYTFAVYEYNTTGTCYLTPPTTVTFTTTACAASQCPYITSVVVNSCEGSCAEGDNEIIFMNSGSYSFSATPTNVQTFYENITPPTTNYTESFATNATTISAMNTAAGCGSLFVDVSSGTTIPANSAFMIVRSSMCQNAYDWTTLCGSGPIYVLFSTDASWAVGGNFVNGGGIRYFRTNYSNVNAGCVIDYSYDANLLTGGNGAFITYGTSGGAPTGYFNNGCVVPTIVLPVTIDNFYGKRITSSIELNWLVSQESGIVHYEIEKSLDAFTYQTIGNIVATRNNLSHQYSFEDNAPNAGINYYRLFSVGADGMKQYHKTISVNYNDQITNDYSILYQNDGVSIHLNNESANSYVRLYNLSGQLLGTYFFNENKEANLKFSKEELQSGMYMVRIFSANKIYNNKIIIH